MAQHTQQEPFQELTISYLRRIYELPPEELVRVTRIALPKESLNAENLGRFCKVLAQCPNLIKLDLVLNNLGPEGVNALASALPALTGLQTLYLGRNSLGPEGVQALVSALPALTGLQTLYLGSNSLGPEGARALAEVLPFTNITECLTIQFFELEDNEAIQKALEANRKRLKLQQSILTLVLACRRLRKLGLSAELWQLVGTNLLDMTLPEHYVLPAKQPAATPPEQDDKRLNPTNGSGM